jgi:hypothetical protein
MTSHVRPALVGLETADLGRASVDLALSNEVGARPRGGPEHNCGPSMFLPRSATGIFSTTARRAAGKKYGR